MFYWKGDIQSLHFFTLRGRKQQRTSLWSFDVKEMEGNNKIVRAWKTIQHCNEGRHLSIGWRFLVPVLLHIRFSCERSRTARNNLNERPKTFIQGSYCRYNELFKRKWHLGFYESAIILPLSVCSCLRLQFLYPRLKKGRNTNWNQMLR